MASFGMQWRTSTRKDLRKLPPREVQAVTLEKRMKTVEKKMAALANGLARKSPGKKDRRATVGFSEDDPGFEEMIRLGRVYRQGLRSRSGRAHS
jgi:hypothetical protein